MVPTSMVPTAVPTAVPIGSSRTYVTMFPAVVLTGITVQQLKSDSIAQKVLVNAAAVSAKVPLEFVSIGNISAASGRRLLEADQVEEEKTSSVLVTYKFHVLAEQLGYTSSSASDLAATVLGSLQTAVQGGSFVQTLKKPGSAKFSSVNVDKQATAKYIQTAIDSATVAYAVTSVPSGTPTATWIPTSNPPPKNAANNNDSKDQSQVSTIIIAVVVPVGVVLLLVAFALYWKFYKKPADHEAPLSEI